MKDDLDVALETIEKREKEIDALREGLKRADDIANQYSADCARAERELAALRAQREADIAALSFGRNAALEREKAARALLAEVTFWLEEAWGRNDDETLVKNTQSDALGAVAWDAIQNARAFLDPRRDEARGDEEKTVDKSKWTCSCGSPVGCWHDNEPARDEARRARVTERIKRIADKYHETLARLGDDSRAEARREVLCKATGEMHPDGQCPVRDEARRGCGRSPCVGEPYCDPSAHD